VAPRRLHHVLAQCQSALVDCRKLAADAHRWWLPGSRPHISRKHRDWMVEVAYLRSFLALEAFLEETFILYSLGHKAPRGRPPYRFTFPPNKKSANDWVQSENRPHTSWDANAVRRRAGRFFRNGDPFESVLSGQQSALEEARTIRNSIAHDSSEAVDKFHNVVRKRLGAVPVGVTAGSFLDTNVPGVNPPQSFLDHYIDKIDFVVTQIVPR
jgi:hypothetical protein